MSIGINQFQALSRTEGFVRADPKSDAAPLKTFGGGVFGKVSTWVRDPGPEAHQALKEDFKTALQQKYGYAFANSVANTVDGERNAPLAARTVRTVMSQAASFQSQSESTLASRADSPTPAPSNGAARPAIALGPSVTIDHSAYASEAELRGAAKDLLRNAGFKAEGAAVFGALSDFTNRPADNGHLLLDPRRNGNGAGTRLMQALGAETEQRQDRIIAANNPLLKGNVEAVDRAAGRVRTEGESFQAGQFALPLYQFPTKLPLLSRELAAAAGKPDDKAATAFGQIAKEMVDVTRTQIKGTAEAIGYLSNPATLTDLPAGDRAALLSLRDQLVDIHAAMVDPKGIYQQMVAFAAVVQADPSAAVVDVRDAIAGKLPPTPPPLPSRDGRPPLSTETPPPLPSRDGRPPLSTETPPPLPSRDGRPPLSTASEAPLTAATWQPGRLKAAASARATTEPASTMPPRTTVRLGGDTTVSHSAFKNEAELRAAAIDFAQMGSGSGATGTATFRNIAEFVADPVKNAHLLGAAKADARDSASRLVLALAADPALMERLSKFPKDANLTITVRVIETTDKADAPRDGGPSPAFGRSPDAVSAERQRNVAETMLRPFLDFPKAWGQLFQDLEQSVASGTTDEVRAASRKVLADTQAQINGIEETIADMRKVRDRVPTDNLADFTAHQAKLGELRDAMMDPAGLYQKGLAYAAVVAADPAGAKALATA